MLGSAAVLKAILDNVKKLGFTVENVVQRALALLRAEQENA